MGITLNLENYKSTFTQTSKPDYGHEFIVNDTIEVYNFDKIKDAILQQVGLNNECRSCDTLVMIDNKNIIIEFKKTTYSKLLQIETNIDPKCLKRKLLDSKNLLYILHESSLLKYEKDVVYVVYEDGERTVQTALKADEVELYPIHISRRFSRLISNDKNKEPIDFGLEKMQGTLYDEVHTYSKLEFMEKFINLHCEDCSPKSSSQA